MEFRLLGSLEAVHERPLPLGSAKQRTLLAILLLHPNQVLSSDVLIDLLWGARPPRSADNTLQGYVSGLRHAVGRSIIVTHRPGYSIRVDPAQIDTHVFERLLREGRKAAAACAWSDAAPVLRQALDLRRGPALADFVYEDFAQSEINRLEELRAEAVEARADAELGLGHHRSVVADLEQLCERHPLRERAAGQLMVALYRSDRQAEALTVYQRVREALREQLGLDPSPTLTALEDAILLQKPELSWMPDRRPAAPAGPPFIGRGAEQTLLRRCLDSTLAGAGRLVLVTGEAGGGKSRLARWMAEIAAEADVPLFWGRCHEDGQPPYWPWSEAFHDHPAAGDGIAARWGDAGTIDWDSHDAGAAEASRFQILHRSAADLCAASRTTPMIIVLDDLQWADSSSLHFLQLVSERLAESRLLVVALYRPISDRCHPLTETLGVVARHATTERIDLGPFTTSEIERLIEAATGVGSVSLAADLHRRTAGNPFFVVEMLRHRQASTNVAGVPAGVRDVLRRRIARLSGTGQEVLVAAAAIGPDFAFPLVAAVCGLDEPLVLDALEECVGDQLIVEDDRTPGCFRFAHDLVREAILGELSGARAVRLHVKIGAALESGAGPRTPAAVAQLAHHFYEAAQGGGDVDKAVRYAEAAARQAIAALAYEDAVSQYDRAIRVLESADRPDPLRHCQLLLARGAAEWRSGAVPAARASCLAAAREARDIGDTYLLANAVVAVGGGRYRTWHASRGVLGDELVALLQEALAGLGPGDSELRVGLLGYLAEELYFTDDEARFDLSREGLEMARRIGRPLTLARALSSRCQATWGPDHLEERRATAEELVVLAGQLDSAELGLFGRKYQLLAALEACDVGTAWAVLDDFTDRADRLRQPLYRWEASRFAALKALFLGEFDAAERLAGEAFEIGERAGDPDAMNVFAVQFGMVMLERGRAEEIVAAMTDLAGELHESPAWQAAVCFILADLGRSDEARAALERLAVDRFAAVPRNFAWLASLAMLSLACARLADPDNAAVLYDLLEPYAARHVVTGDRNSWGSCSYYLGVLASSVGAWERAERWFETALAAHTAMGSPPWIAHTQADFAAMLIERGEASDLERAARLTAAAFSTACDLGMARLQGRLKPLLSGVAKVRSG